MNARFRNVAIAASVIAASACATRPSEAQAAPTPPLVRPFTNARHWVLAEPMTYRIGSTKDSVVVPAGFVTDFASIPQRLHSFLSPNSPVLTPAIVHDYLYWNQGCTREEADRVFHIAMRETRVVPRERELIFSAVDKFGGRAFRSNAADRAGGKPRIIPEEYRRIPALVRWENYQRMLISRGIRAEPPVAIPEAFCAWGRRGANPPGVP